MKEHGLRPRIQAVIDNHVGSTVVDSILAHCARASGETLYRRPVTLEPVAELFEVDSGVGKVKLPPARVARGAPAERWVHLRFRFRAPLQRTDVGAELLVRGLAALQHQVLWTVCVSSRSVDYFISIPQPVASAVQALVRSCAPWCEVEAVPRLLELHKPVDASFSTGALFSAYSRAPYPLLLSLPPSRAASPARSLARAAAWSGAGMLLFQVQFGSLAPLWVDNCRRIASAAKHATAFSPVGPHLSLVQQLAHDGAVKTEEEMLVAASIRAAVCAPGSPDSGHEAIASLLSSQRHGSQPLLLHRGVDYDRAGITASAVVKMFLHGTVHSRGCFLTPRELLQFVEPPGEDLVADRSIPLARLRGPSTVSMEMAGGPLLGCVDGSGGRLQVHQPEHLRTRHTLLIGVTGKGKSSTLERLILWDIEHGNGLIALDLGGDLMPRITAQVPARLAARVVYLNPGLPGYTIAYNHLDLPLGMDLSAAAERAVAIDRGLFDSSSWGPNIDTVLLLAYTALMSAGGNCRADLPVLLGLDAEGRALRRALLEHVQNPEVARFLEQGIERLPADLRSRVVSKVKRLLAHELLCRIVSQRQSKFSFRDLLDRGMAVLIDLPPHLGLGVTSLTASLFTNDAFCAALGRADQDPDQRKPAFLYVDEVQRLLEATYLDHCLQECRKYGVGVHLAFQYPEQLPTDLRAAICNAATIMAFGVRRTGAERLSKDFGLDVPVGDLMFQEPGQAIVSMDGRVVAISTPKPAAVRRGAIPEAILKNSLEVAYSPCPTALREPPPTGPAPARGGSGSRQRNVKSPGWDEI